MPKVSVIMGVYNCKSEKMLRESVESIVKQSYTDWEFIICNDGSSEHTGVMLNHIKQMDDRIKIISYRENRGLNYALNECLKIANGEYIARQDDDDRSDLRRLEKQVAFLDDNKEYALVGTIADVYDDQGVWGEYIVEEKPEKKSFFWNSPFMHPTIMVRAEAYKKCNGYRVAKETRRCEDYDLFMRMYACGFKGYNIQEKLYLYRLLNDPKKKYRPMKYRIDEAKVRFKGYKEMKILKGKAFAYVLKPIVIGLIPQFILCRIKKIQH